MRGSVAETKRIRGISSVLASSASESKHWVNAPISAWHRLMAQHEYSLLARRDHKLGGDASVFELQRPLAFHRKLQVSGRKNCAEAILLQMDLGRLARIIECRPAHHAEFGVATGGACYAHQLMGFLIGFTTRFAADGHKIDHLGHTAVVEEARQQHVRIGQVDLLDLLIVGRTQAEAAAFLVVQEGTENAGGVKAGKTAPVDRAVAADQRHRMQVADNAIAGDGLIAHYRVSLADGTVSVGGAAAAAASRTIAAAAI